MKKKRIAQYCCAALVLVGMGLNIQNALTGYGLGENTLSLVASSGSENASCIESVSFFTLSNSNLEDVTETVTRCGSFGGRWIAKGLKPKFGFTWNQIVTGIIIPLGLNFAISEWGEQKTHYEWEEIYNVHTGECTEIDGEMKEKVLDIMTCKEKEGPGDSCYPLNYSRVFDEHYI